jgi:pyruvate ferredoxin oxidoreductase beta subunit
MAVETGVWPLKEAIDGRVKHTVMMRSNRRPLEEYLRMQGRFEHLFEPVLQENVLKELQKKVDDYWASVSG